MVDLVPGTANRAVREVIDGKEVYTPIVQTGGDGASGGLTEEQLAAITGRPADAAPAISPTDPSATMLSLLRAMMSQNAAMLNLLANCVQELEAINANTKPSP